MVQALLKVKLTTSTSFRAIAKISVIIALYLRIGTKSPKHTTVLLWVKKIGVYQLIKPKEKATDWILLLDESISIGQEKLLLIMGIRQSKINFNRPLRYQDLTPLRSISRTKWKAEDISTLISEIKGERYREFTIAHIGIWTLQQAHKEIIESLKNILSENKEWIIRFVLVGNIHPEIIEELTKIPNLIIDHRGKVSQKDALQEMMNADVLLNCLAILPNSKILISGKLMEYLATGNSMVVIGDKEGDAAG